MNQLFCTEIVFQVKVDSKLVTEVPTYLFAHEMYVVDVHLGTFRVRMIILGRFSNLY
jgi:hypothetical protein